MTQGSLTPARAATKASYSCCDWLGTALGVYTLWALLPNGTLKSEINASTSATSLAQGSRCNSPHPAMKPSPMPNFLSRRQRGACIQVAFFIIDRDPARHGPLMTPAYLKSSALPFQHWYFLVQDRIGTAVLIAGMVDLFLRVLFVVALLRHRATRPYVGSRD